MSASAPVADTRAAQKSQRTRGAASSAARRRQLGPRAAVSEGAVEPPVAVGRLGDAAPRLEQDLPLRRREGDGGQLFPIGGAQAGKKRRWLGARRPHGEGDAGEPPLVKEDHLGRIEAEVLCAERGVEGSAAAGSECGSRGCQGQGETTRRGAPGASRRAWARAPFARKNSSVRARVASDVMMYLRRGRSAGGVRRARGAGRG